MPLGIICATGVIFFYNTLYIAFNFIVILIIAATIVFCLKAEFLAYTILIVYIGAIAVLFLFVIMILNLNITGVAVLSTWELCIALFLVIKILIISKIMLIPNVVSCLGKGLIGSNFWSVTKGPRLVVTPLPQQIESLGHLLYVDFYYLFLMIGILLLVAMVGALVLTTSIFERK
jgi:NADH-quinone oxidoreductase subunit J